MFCSLIKYHCLIKKYIRMINLHLFHNLPITALAHYSHFKIINTTSCWDGMSGSNRSRVLVCFPYTCFSYKRRVLFIVKNARLPHQELTFKSFNNFVVILCFQSWIRRSYRSLSVRSDYSYAFSNLHVRTEEKLNVSALASFGQFCIGFLIHFSQMSLNGRACEQITLS